MATKLPTLSLLLFFVLGPSMLSAADAYRLTPQEEPGEPLLVSGQVVGADGKTPVPGARVRVYHTDREGFYSPGSTQATDPRIDAVIPLDPKGRYSFRTIRPGAYPDSGVPAHIHYVVSGDGFPEQRFTLHFAGDPRLSRRTVERSDQAGRFGSVQPLKRDSDGVWQVRFDLKLTR